MHAHNTLRWIGALTLSIGVPGTALGAGGANPAPPLRPASVRYAAPATPEKPDFRRHVVPVLGVAGCNSRACHGSFQGQGGFRLSLFGYDFPADHQALMAPNEERVNAQAPKFSLVLAKPTLAQAHAGGQRLKAGTWQYHVIRRWIESGAPGPDPAAPELAKLEVTPKELHFSKAGQSLPVRVVAHWADGSTEDVTPLCRYQTNDEAIAEVDSDGLVTSKDAGDTHVVAFYDHGVAVTQVLRPVSAKVGPSYPNLPAPTQIDMRVSAKLRKLGLVPSALTSDAEFLRRVSLDVTGTLPAPAEVLAFTADPAPEKRAKKVEELLSRPTYTARWATKLSEITGNSPKQFDGTGPPEEFARQWYAWIERRVRENVPYDQLVAGMVLGRSRTPGRSYREFIEEQSAYYREKDPLDFTTRETMPYYWAKHSSRTPEERALNFSYTFLGVRLDCAQCHKHPFDRWTQGDFMAFTAFFEPLGYGVPSDAKKEYQELIDKLADRGNQNQRERARLVRAQKGEVVPWREVFVAPPGTRLENGRAVPSTPGRTPRVLGGPAGTADPQRDPLSPLMEWMRRKDNPFFARAFINRVWAEYFGRGIVHPADDMNLANPPSNAALLDYLVEGFIAHGFDMKWLHREIVTSHTYQRSMTANETNALDERNFSRHVARRMPAEVLFDAIVQATGSSADLGRVATAVSDRAIGPNGGALVGARGVGDYASKVFGRSPRDTNCDCSASLEPNLLQAIYLQNDRELLAAIERKPGWLNEVRVRLGKAGKAPAAAELDALIGEAYLRTLARPPTPAEAERSRKHFEAVGEPVESLHDLLWALLNTREFATNH